jgi:RNA-directed DNA polymerase
MVSRTASRIFESATTPSNLTRIYEEHVKGKKARGRDGIRPDALDSDIEAVTELISRKLRTGTYRFSAYREFLELKGPGKPPRVLSVPTARDRISLRALAGCIGEIFPKTRGVIPHLRVQQVAEVVQAATFDSYIKLDIENFYPSVEHALIENALRTKIRKKEVLDSILKAVRTPTLAESPRNRPANTQGIPQGLAISNSLAELVMQGIDENLPAQEECFYVRYVDDVLILCDSAVVQQLYRHAVTRFEQIGLKVHAASSLGGKSSSGAISDGFDYLGYTFNSTTVSVRQQSIRNIESSIARIFTRYKYDRNLRQLQSRINVLVTGCIYGGNPYGWLNYFRQMNDLTLLKRLDIKMDEMKRRSKLPTGFRTKSFVRAYWAITHPHGKDRRYIPNYDLSDADEMRQILAAYLGEEEVSKIADRNLGSEFTRFMRQMTVDLERDIGHLS